MNAQVEMLTLLKEVQRMHDQAGKYLHAGELAKLNITTGEIHRRIVRIQQLEQQVMREVPAMLASAASVKEKLGRFSATA